MFANNFGREKIGTDKTDQTLNVLTLQPRAVFHSHQNRDQLLVALRKSLEETLLQITTENVIGLI